MLEADYMVILGRLNTYLATISQHYHDQKRGCGMVEIRLTLHGKQLSACQVEHRTREPAKFVRYRTDPVLSGDPVFVVVSHAPGQGPFVQSRFLLVEGQGRPFLMFWPVP